MKKVVYLVILVLAVAYGVGRVRLGEMGALQFLTNMEDLIQDGKADEVCDLYHEDLEVEIVDSTGGTENTLSGGKEELCELTRATVAGLNLVPNSMRVSFTEVNAKHDWKHPWTGEISYLENRSLTINGTNVTLRTVSNDEITLVHTFSGVKLRKIRSEVYKADAT
jgi:hypothetical protein